MTTITHLETGHYRIPLAQILTDSTHGEMRGFEIVTCRVFDKDGAEGVGYTFTNGRNGGAIHDLLTREFPELVVGQEADRVERLWETLWWAFHYGVRLGRP